MSNTPKVPRIMNSGSGKIQHHSSSVASACSGADARLADVVSPRSSDGLIADKALHLYRLMHAVGSRSAAGFVIIGSELVRISIKSQENTDHSPDGT